MNASFGFKRRALQGLVGLGLLACAGWASAQAGDWPNKPVKVIITFTAGSSTDIVGRVVTQRLSEVWGQPMIVENKPGAGGNLGADLVAKAAPDEIGRASCRERVYSNV